MKNSKEESSQQAKKKLKLSASDLAAQAKPVDLQDIRFNFDTHRLKSEFYDCECLELSKKLLNKFLVRRFDATTLAIGKIVETEAYLGGDDKASHTYNNKQTDRVKAMYMAAGHAYVYNIYGMYCCLNISAREPGAGVLIRALEPFFGAEVMRKNRNLSEEKAPKELTNGPSKLCMAMGITKNSHNEVDLSSSEDMWLQDELSPAFFPSAQTDQSEKFEIIAAKRIGIDYAGEEAINKLYRFYIRGNKFVSVKAKSEVIV